ncbi:MAG: ankyrin repeat domain-containing protein, partial [bacterium]
KVLLAHKANPLIKNALNKTPIDIAKASGNPEYIALLISDEEIEKALNNACMSGDLGTLKEFPNKIKPELINKKLDNSNHTPLHLAILEIKDSIKRLSVVKFLIQKGANLRAVNTAGSTPLHIACYQKDNEEIIKLLIEEDDGLLKEQNDLGQTALDIAQELGYRKYEPLLKKTKKLSDDEIEEALAKACEDGDLGILEAYTGPIKKNINKVFNEDLPFLHRAVSNNKLNIVNFLLTTGADINLQSSMGSKPTPLHLACRIPGAEERIKLLVEKGADIHKKNNLGETPLDIAKKSNIPEYPKLLVKELPNAEIERALNEVRLSGNLGPLESYPHPIDKNIIDNNVNGLTVLHEACMKGFLNVAQFLIKKEAGINAVDPKKNTPLHLACLKKDNEDVIRFLLENKDIDLTLKNTAGQTPRQIAEQNNKQYVKVFQEFEEQECSICHKKHKPISFYTTPCDHKFCILCIVEKGLLNKFEETDFTCPTCNEKLNLDDIEQWYQPEFWKDLSWDDIKTEAKKEIAKKLDQIKDQLRKLYNIKNRSLQKDDELEKLNKKFKREIKVLDKLEVCPLCQLDEREEIYTTYCGHKFCYNCVIPTAINSVQRMGTFVCPTCRRGVLKDEVNLAGHPVIEYESINDSKDIPKLKTIWKKEQWKKLAENELLVKITELAEENFPEDYNGQHYNFGFGDTWMNRTGKRKKHEQALNTLLKDLNPDLCDEKTYKTTCGDGYFAPKHVFRYTYFIKLAVHSIQKRGLSLQGNGSFECPICHRIAETLAATDQQNVVVYKPTENSLKINELKDIWKQDPWKKVAKEELNKRITEIMPQNFPTDPDEQMDKFGFQGEDVRKERQELLENLLGEL